MRDSWPFGLALLSAGVLATGAAISRDAFLQVHLFCEWGMVVAFWTAGLFTVRLWPRRGKRLSLGFVMNGLMSGIFVVGVGFVIFREMARRG